MEARRTAAQAGFTLVELVIVMTIIGILVLLPIASYLHFRDQANDAVARGNVHEAVVSIDSYYTENATYVGMTLPGLRDAYDSGLVPSHYTLNGLTGDEYCISSTAGGQSWRKDGPGHDYEKGSC